jgi:hypothetical protein
MIFEASGRAPSGANPEIAEFGDPLIACLNIVGPNWPRTSFNVSGDRAYDCHLALGSLGSAIQPWLSFCTV